MAVGERWYACVGCGEDCPKGVSGTGYCAQCWVDGLVPPELVEPLGPAYADYAPDLKAQAERKKNA